MPAQQARSCKRIPASLSAHEQREGSYFSSVAEELISQGVVWRGDTASGRHHRAPQNTPHTAISFNAPEIDSQLPAGGLACSAIHELFYHNSTHTHPLPLSLPIFFVARAIDSYSSMPSSSWDRPNAQAFPFFILWIGKRCWPTPFSIPSRYLSSCIFINPPTEKLTLWSIETALRSSAVKLVISDCPRISLTTTRRFSHAAKTHGTTALLLRQHKDLDLPSSSTTKWLVSPTPSVYPFPLWKLSLEKIKGAAPSITSWIIGLENDYEGREAISLRVFPPMVDRGYQEEPTLERFGT
jgi:hypothetical protein